MTDESEDNGGSGDTYDKRDPTLVKVGTKEYLDGFISSPIRASDPSPSASTTSDRGSGLEQAIKLAGGVSLFLIVAIVGFMASNGLI